MYEETGLTHEQIWCYQQWEDLQQAFPNLLEGEQKSHEKFMEWWKTHLPGEREVRLGGYDDVKEIHEQKITNKSKYIKPRPVRTPIRKLKVMFLWCGVKINGWNCQKPGGTCEQNYMNHGLASISASVLEAGHDTFLVDLRALKDWKEFDQLIISTKYDAVVLGFHSVDEPIAREAVQKIKSVKPKIPIIVGGVHVTITKPEEFENAETVAYGEGEKVVVDWLELIERGAPLPSVIQESKEKLDLDTIPFVDRSLFNTELERNNPFLPLLPPPMYTINFGRGCYWGRCAFCHESDRHVKYSVRTPENCINEIISLMPVGSLMIHDDIFPHKKWCERFIRLWVQRGLPRIPFWCQMRADFIVKNPDLIADLSEFGLTWVSLGVESNSQRMLDFLDKGTTTDQNYEACNILHKNNVNIFCDMIFAVPTETEEDVEASGQFLAHIKPAGLSLSTYTCYPGSKLHSYCKEIDAFSDESYSMIRYPYELKIKGIDYQKLFQRLGEFNQYKGDLRHYQPRNRPLREYTQLRYIRPKTRVPLLVYQDIPNENKIKNPKVSFIITSYQRPEMLTEAVNTLFDQTDESWEAIIIDCSKTNITDTLKELAKDHRVRIYRAVTDSISTVWNLGLDKMRGKYWNILDDDNKKNPKFVESMAGYLDKNPEYDAVSCFFYTINEKGVKNKVVQSLASKYTKQKILEGNYFDSGAILFRKELLDTIGFYDENLMTLEDWDYNKRVAWLGRGIGLIQDALAQYRVHYNQRMTHDVALGRIEDQAYIQSKKPYLGYEIMLISPPDDRLTQSQRDVIMGVRDGLISIEWVNLKYKKSDEKMPNMKNVDLVINIAPFEMTMEELGKIKNASNFVANLHMEDPPAFKTNLERMQFCNIVITNDPSVIDRYETEIGVGMVYFMPMLSVNGAILPKISNPTKKYDIAFLGYPYKSRIQFITELIPHLAGHKVVLIGNEWNRHIKNNNIEILPTMPQVDTVRTLASSKIVVVMQRKDSDLGGVPDGITQQAIHRGYFECASGSVVMVDDSSRHHVFNGDEVVFYDDRKDLVDKISFCLKFSDLSKEIGERAMNRAFTDFTYKRRLTKLLMAIRSIRFGYWVD